MIPWWGSSQPTQAEPTIAESLAELGRLFAVVSWRMEMATVERSGAIYLIRHDGEGADFVAMLKRN